MKKTCCKSLPSLALLVVAAVSLGISLAEAPTTSKPSKYAPAKDLLAQVDSFVKKIEFDLEDGTNFNEDQAARIENNANTLAALALVLGMHDEPNPLKGAAPSIVAASQKLADQSEDHAKASAALAQLKKAIEGGKGGKLEWKPVADVAQLMKQVPIVNNSLRRGVEGRRFSRVADRNAGYAATLAAIAQASAADTSYCADKEDEAQWKKFCAELRDAAAKVNAQVRKGNQEAAVQGLGRIAKSCDACHHAFDVK